MITWSAAPSLRQATVVALLSSQAEAEEQRPEPSVRVTPVLYLREEYRYAGEADGPVLTKRLVPWTFERSAAAGGQWKLAEIRAERWYYQRNPSSDDGSDDEGGENEADRDRAAANHARSSRAGDSPH
mmetsp:Transcript_31327/g.74274  ORF Transcript_31327/g.74274 Transcript_31327/m.74274 type:complete len:128 (+) Transcript_31327:242-625(+)